MKKVIKLNETQLRKIVKETIRNYTNISMPIAGFTRFHNKNGYNYVNIHTHKLLSPVDFEKCSEFDPMTNTAEAEVNIDGDIVKLKFYSVNNGENVRVYFFDEGEWKEIEYSDFCEIASNGSNYNLEWE